MTRMRPTITRAEFRLLPRMHFDIVSSIEDAGPPVAILTELTLSVHVLMWRVSFRTYR